MRVIPQSYEILQNESSALKQIASRARICYKSEDKAKEDETPFVQNGIIKRQHNSCLEMAVIHVKFKLNPIEAITQTLNFVSAKYLTMSIGGNGDCVVTGSVRAWREFQTPNMGFDRIVQEYVLSTVPELSFDMPLLCVEQLKGTQVMEAYGLRILSDEEVIEECPYTYPSHIHVAVKLITNRAVTHEIVRHRPMAYLQESQRYCVAGSMRLHFKNPHQQYTIEEFYNKTLTDPHKRWKRSKIRQLDEHTGEIVYASPQHVTFMGSKDTITITTKLGYTICTTADHEVRTTSGYTAASCISIGDELLVNGTTVPYHSKTWLYEQYITQHKTAVSIASDVGVQPSTIKKWLRVFGYSSSMKPNWQLGKVGNSKGVKYNPVGHAKSGYRSGYQTQRGDACEKCGNTQHLHVHHINENKQDNSEQNLMTLCPSCHTRVHNKSLQFVISDKVVNVQHTGVQNVYEIGVDSAFSNFIANGVVVHNCRYDKDQFGNEVTFIKPMFYAEGSAEYDLWVKAMRETEAIYLKLLGSSSPQAARTVLPNSCKTEIIMYGTLQQYNHIFALRTSKEAEPSMREVMVPLLEDFRAMYPEVFEVPQRSIG